MTNVTEPSFKLNEDALSGFTTAVTNGQVRLALEYATVLFSNLRTSFTVNYQAEIEELKSRIAELEASKAPSRKVSGKQPASSQPDSEPESKSAPEPKD